MTDKDTIGKIELGHNQTVIDEDAWLDEQFKKRWPLLDMKFFDEMQAVLDIGSETDGKGDWREREIVGAAEWQAANRHVRAWAVITIDPDSNQPTAAHIACRAMISRYQERKGEK